MPAAPRAADASGSNAHAPVVRWRDRSHMRAKLFINGEFVDAAAGGRIAVLNPYDNSQICEIAEARAEDVDNAVDAATKAQKSWRRSDPSQRGRLLLKLADAIEANGEE